MVTEKKEKGSCPCPKTGCSRHGNCEACREHHHKINSLTRCERNEKKGKTRE